MNISTFFLHIWSSGHNLLFPTIVKQWRYEISITIHVSTFTIDLVFENCFLSAMAPYVYSRDVGGAYPYMDLNAKYKNLL